MLLEAIIAFFAAIGVFAVVYACFGVIPVTGKRVFDGEVHVFIKAGGACGGLDKVIKRLMWVKNNGLCDLRVSIADAGLDGEGMRAVRRAEREPCVKLVSGDGLIEQIESLTAARFE